MNRVPRPASTICLLRDTGPGLEVLMVRRTPAARFMGGAWVFPGGAVDADDEGALAREAVVSSNADLLPWRAAAVRELVEETGIWLLNRGTIAAQDRPDGAQIFAAALEGDHRFGADSLHYFANWITPQLLPVRFDTRFFGFVVDEDVEPFVDGVEVVDAQWLRPTEALRRSGDGTWVVAFPTLRTLECLGEFATTDAFEEHADVAATVVPVEPRLVVVDGALEILMPADPGFAEAAPDRMEPTARAAVERFIGAARSESTEAGSA